MWTAPTAGAWSGRGAANRRGRAEHERSGHVQHFAHLTRSQLDALFERPPEPFDRDSGSELLSGAPGAPLYMPADRPTLGADLTKQAQAGVTSVVICLEDSVADEHV